ncbi:ESX secretion-associated protein EspG, partial [Mycolicibacterium sp. CBMA 361]
MPLGLQPLKPYIPVAHGDLVVETDMGRQPITATAEYDSLRRAGVIDERGDVDAVVRDWMTVLSKPDREVMLRIRTPDQLADDDNGATVFERSLVICRHQNRYMAMGARYGDEIVIGGVGEAQAPHRQIELMLPILIPAFGEGEAADIDG